MTKLPPKKCLHCGRKTKRPGKRGPLPLYCSTTCRQNAYVKRKHLPGALARLQQDIDLMRLRSLIAREVARVLLQMKVITPEQAAVVMPRRHQSAKILRFPKAP